MKYLSGVLLLVCSLSGVALEQDWHCRNHDVEVTCAQDKCQASESFTPLDVYLSATGELSIGMYSGVWEGRARVLTEQNYHVVIARGLVFSSAMERKADFIMTLNTIRRVATLEGYGYVVPMTCKASSAN